MSAPPEPEPTAKKNRRRGVLVVSVYHGFGNRIRTVAAAAALAEEVGRDLHVHWCAYTRTPPPPPSCRRLAPLPRAHAPARTRERHA